MSYDRTVQKLPLLYAKVLKHADIASAVLACTSRVPPKRTHLQGHVMYPACCLSIWVVDCVYVYALQVAAGCCGSGCAGPCVTSQTSMTAWMLWLRLPVVGR